MSDKLFDKYILNQYEFLTNTNKPLLHFRCFITNTTSASASNNPNDWP